MEQSSNVASTNSGTVPSINTASLSKNLTVIVDPSSSEEKTSAAFSGFVQQIESHQTPKRVSSSTLSSPALASPPCKLLGRNYNGTMVNTSTPTNEAEIQLYKVLQRASLLSYYDTLLEMGGDDLQQLVDCGQAEFLEIMELVGMSSKPLHVRRLQKALHEWMTNPSLFQSPLPSNVDAPPIIQFNPEPGSISAQQMQQHKNNFTSTSSFSTSNPNSSPHPSTSYSFCALTSSSSYGGTPVQVSTSSSSTSANVLPLNPSLTESQIARIVASAERLARSLPQQLEPRTQNMKKRSARELEKVIAMNETDPRRMNEIRKYSAIYGRFDAKRKPEKALTLHEVCVNEAAAHICKFIPALLTRRDELFPLARQVVRDSGFGHSATIRLMSQAQTNRSDELEHQHEAKKQKFDRNDSESDMGKDYMNDSTHHGSNVFSPSIKPFDLSMVLNASHQIKQSLNQRKDSFMKNFGRYTTSDFDDNDSRCSFSSGSSPTHNGNTDRDSIDPLDFIDKQPDDMKNFESSPLGVQVISSSGGNIIAVTNPALALSPTFTNAINIKREVVSPEIQ